MRTIFIILILFFLLNYLLPHLVKKWWRKSFLKWANDSGKIYLTFDDGPDISTTGQILDILKTHGIRATFFVLGINVIQNPEIIQRIIKDGHTIGLHGHNHLNPWNILPWKGMLDLSYGKKILEKNGMKTNYVRPPYGKLNILSLIYILINHLKFIHWNIDPKDYNENESDRLTKRLKNEIQKGKVILLHDGRLLGTSPGNITVKGLSDFLENTNISVEVFSTLPTNRLKLF
jgi:peptidoglycan/xylan/chitin deacetylase (PgdA/CDA1 family)